VKSIYKLLLYLPTQDNLSLIDSIYGEDKEYLEGVARERLANNSEYTPILISYSMSEAKLISNNGENDEIQSVG
jgi:hypothetical protein